MQTLDYGPGSIIFAEGDTGRHMFILLEGKVELKKQVGTGEQLLRTLEKRNCFFGEMALIDEQPRSATAVAAIQTKLALVNRDTFEHLILKNGKFALSIIRILSERIRHANKQVSELIQMVPQERFLGAMVEYAEQFGEQIYNKGVKIHIDEMKRWINHYYGLSEKDIDGYLHKLIRTNQTSYAATARESRDEIVLSRDFLDRHAGTRIDPTSPRGMAE
jgi:CRP-like cAMP-binding protein